MPFPFSIIACGFSQPFPNTNIYGGAVNPATTLSGCQNACRMNTSCQGIDWAPGNANGQQCFLLSTQNGKNPNINGVTHYDYTCNGTGTITACSLFCIYITPFASIFASLYVTHCVLKCISAFSSFFHSIAFFTHLYYVVRSELSRLPSGVCSVA